MYLCRRLSGSVVSINEVGSGSVLVGSRKEFRVFPSVRVWTNRVFVVGFTGPVSLANAEYVVTSSVEVRDAVVAGMVVYWSLLDATTGQPALGGANDYVACSLYG